MLQICSEARIGDVVEPMTAEKACRDPRHDAPSSTKMVCAVLVVAIRRDPAGRAGLTAWPTKRA